MGGLPRRAGLQRPARAVFRAAARRQKADSSSFFLAGRTLTWPIVGASLFATNIGAEHMVGLSGDAYRYGICAGTVELTTAICLGFAAAVLLPYYMKNRVFTIPEFLELRFRPEARLCFSGLMLFICVVTKMAFCMYAGALVLQAVTGWGIMQSVLIMGVTTAIITMIGGFGVVAYTDAIHSPIMIAGSADGALYRPAQGRRVGRALRGGAAFARARRDAHPQALDRPHLPVLGRHSRGRLWRDLLLGHGPGQRPADARRPGPQQARWGAMFAVLLKLTPVFIFALPGVIALALYPHINVNDSRATFIWILDNLLPSGVRGYVLSALLGAVLSALIAVMNSISTMAVRDFILRFRPQTSEAGQVTLGRLAIVVAMLAGRGRRRRHRLAARGRL